MDEVQTEGGANGRIKGLDHTYNAYKQDDCME